MLHKTSQNKPQNSVHFIYNNIYIYKTRCVDAKQNYIQNWCVNRHTSYHVYKNYDDNMARYNYVKGARCVQMCISTLCSKSHNITKPTHTHVYIYIYLYILYMCTHIRVQASFKLNHLNQALDHTRIPHKHYIRYTKNHLPTDYYDY